MVVWWSFLRFIFYFHSRLLESGNLQCNRSPRQRTLHFQRPAARCRGRLQSRGWTSASITALFTTWNYITVDDITEDCRCVTSNSRFQKLTTIGFQWSDIQYLFNGRHFRRQNGGGTERFYTEQRCCICMCELRRTCINQSAFEKICMNINCDNICRKHSVSGTSTNVRVSMETSKHRWTKVGVASTWKYGEQ